jgi:hypothetical protein
MTGYGARTPRRGVSHEGERMRAKLIKDCWGPNPKYDWSKRQQDQPNVPCQIVKPAGTVLDDPKAYIHIVDGIAEPEDDEARQWAEEHGLRVAAREAAVAEIREAQRLAAFEGEEEDDE